MRCAYQNYHHNITIISYILLLLSILLSDAQMCNNWGHDKPRTVLQYKAQSRRPRALTVISPGAHER